MKLQLLLNHKNLIPEVAKLKLEELGFTTPEKTLEDYLVEMELFLNENVLPITWVVVEHGKLVGTVSMKPYDMPLYHPIAPLMSSVIVPPHQRKRGVGEFLVKSAEKKGKEFGYDKLCLFTPDKSAWYEKLGWKAIGIFPFNNISVTLMEKDLK